MASRGQAESELLRSNVEDQLNRLLSQLEDLEELKDDLDEDEYKGAHGLRVHSCFLLSFFFFFLFFFLIVCLLDY